LFFPVKNRPPFGGAGLLHLLCEERNAYLVATEKDREQAVITAWRALPTPLQRERVLALLEAFGFGV